MTGSAGKAAKTAPPRKPCSSRPRALGQAVAQVHGLVSGRGAGGGLAPRFPSMEYGDNFFIAGGYGNYLARLAAGLPIRLSSPVERIDWAGEGVRIAIEGGDSIRAQAAIVTVPMMVLREGPSFFRRRCQRRARRHRRLHDRHLTKHAVLHWPSSPSTTVAIGRGLSRPAAVSRRPSHAGSTAPPSTSTNSTSPRRVRSMRRCGGECRAPSRPRPCWPSMSAGQGCATSRFPAVSAVAARDPFSRGSWAVVPPGQPRPDSPYGMGSAVSSGFAGEALSREQWGTVGGAYEQGIRAADAAAQALTADVRAFRIRLAGQHPDGHSPPRMLPGTTMNWIEAIGYLGTALTIASSAMSTMIPFADHLALRQLRRGELRFADRQACRWCSRIASRSRSTPTGCGKLVRLSARRKPRPAGSLTLEWLTPFGTKRRFWHGRDRVPQGRPGGRTLLRRERQVPDSRSRDRGRAGRHRRRARPALAGQHPHRVTGLPAGGEGRCASPIRR